MATVSSMFHSWQKYEIVFRSEKNKEIITKIDVVDLKTKNAYENDSLCLVRLKCLKLFCYTSLCTIFRMSWNLFLQVPFDFSKLVVYLTKDLLSITHIKTCVVAKNVLADLSKGLRDLSQDIINVARPLLYVLPLEFAAFLGIFSPYDGRFLFGQFEKSYNRVSRKKAIRKVKHDEKLSLFGLIFKALNERNSVVHYSAFCFQPVINLKDKKVVSFKLLDKKS